MIVPDDMQADARAGAATQLDSRTPNSNGSRHGRGDMALVLVEAWFIRSTVGSCIVRHSARHIRLAEAGLSDGSVSLLPLSSETLGQCPCVSLR